MTRAVLLTLALLAASASGAQTPDTTTAARYFPLEVGNVWEYERTRGAEVLDRTRHTVTAETDGVFEIQQVGIHESGEEIGPSLITRVRFDAALGGLVVNGDAEALPQQTVTGCGALAAPFGTGFTPGDRLLCSLAPNATEPATVTTFGALGQTVAVGADTRTTSLKGVDTQAGGEAQTFYAAGIGYLGFHARGQSLTLTYARVGGVELGSPFPVAAEPLAPEASSLSAYPNPARETFAIEVPLVAPGTVRVEMFDALGRRVSVLFEGALGAGRHTFRVDAQPLAPGIYAVRATTEAGTSHVCVTIAS